MLPNIEDSRLPGSNIIFQNYFVADAAFPLKKNLMRPYPGKLLSSDRNIFNYRLSRARRVIENAFGILVARWRILKQTIFLMPDNVDKIVLSCIALHNFIKLNDKSNTYVTRNFVDSESENNIIEYGEWRNEVDPLQSIQTNSYNRSSRAAFKLRDVLKEYLNNEGAVPFQANRH